MTLGEKRELAARLLRERTAGAETISPASHVQRSLWLHHRLEPASAAYHVAYALRIRSAVDRGALRRALQALGDRHESLRSTFFIEQGSNALIQRVRGRASVDLNVVSASGLGDGAFRAVVQDAVRVPFDLESGPLFRACLFHRSDSDSVLLITAHHIVMDGWSLILLLDELRQLYAAEHEGSVVRLGRIEARYSDFVGWQNELVSGPEGERLRAFWANALRGELPVLDLPADRARPAIRTSNGATHRFTLPGTLLERLRRFAKSEGATLFTVLLASWFVLLHRHTRQPEIVVGVPSAGRSRKEFERLAGCFINMVAMRCDLSPNLPFREFLHEMRQHTASALSHGDYPFQLLIEDLAPARDASHSPLFQNSFVFQNLQRAAGLTELFERHARGDSADFGGLITEPFEIDQQEGQLEITLEIFETATTLRGICRYNTDLFDKTTIARLLSHFEVLLESIVADAGTPVSRIPLLTEAEMRRLTLEWPAGVCRQWSYQSFPALVDEWGERTPDAVAVEAGTETITYRELTRRSDALAAMLRRRGVEKGSLVAVCLHRSPRIAIAILAIMKAGGAYLPLDPAFPPDRLEFMLADATAMLVVTESDAAGVLPSKGPAHILLDLAEISPGAGFSEDVAPDQLAYVIYTSGSTGRPKGAELLHSGLSNLVRSQQLLFDLVPGHRVLQFASLSFDASVFEIALALGNGGTLVFTDRDNLLPGPELVNSLRRHRISATILPPSTLAALPPAELPDLSLLTVGGEECSEDLVNRWARGRRFFNLYGPTETTIWATAAECKPGCGKPSIGRPLPNTTVHLLDEAMQPVPCGVTGELYIGGASVGRGYLRRPDLTAERFVPDPFSPGSTLYRSGDLARWRTDGSIEFLGRADLQVKLRGFRIEPGEIEAVLKELPEVRDAVVIVRGAQLAAYVASDAVDIDAVMSHLRLRLPDYMRPASVTVLPAFPVSPGGKVDRRALPEPSSEAGYHPPRNETERLLCECFADVLQHSPCGIHDDFFALGGHSLIATQLLARLRAVTGQELTLRTLFENTTPARLAAKLYENRSQAPPLPALAGGPRESSPPLSFAQERLWFLHQLDPLSPAFNVPAALRIRGNLDVTAVERAIREIIARHDVLTARFPVVDGRSAQYIQQECDFSLLRAEGDVAELAAQEAFRPFDLAADPPIRAVIVREREDSHVLLVTMHHIVSDGWSTGVFLREFSMLYRNRPLAPLLVQYGDYARWQRSWLHGEILEAQLEWWKTHLAGVTPVELPASAPRSSTQSGRAGVSALRLDADVVARLKEFTRSEGATLYMALLALFHEILGRYTGSDDVVCGSPVANRNHAGAEELIGFFVNMLVMRGDLSGSPSLRELVARERAFTLGALANQDIPFEILVDELQPQRDLTRSPLFQVTFALHNVPMRIPDIPGLHLEPLGNTARTTRYELEVHLSETDDGAVEGFVLYASDLFESDFIRTFAGHYLKLIEAAVVHPDRPLRDLDITSAEERSALLASGNALTENPVYTADCIHRMVERQAARLARKPAVRFEGQSLTYSELDAEANRIANRLCAAGVGRGSFVGLFLERSLDLIAAMLGILKAGAAYVPLDPVYPPERLRFIISDADMAAVVTQTSLLDQLEDCAATVIALDRDRETILLQPATPPESDVQPWDVAYVIYTSGSTGRPKGVLVTHAKVSRIFPATQEWFGFNENDVWTMFHSSAFDFSVWEIWGALVNGGCLVVVPYETSRSPEAFHRLLLAERVTVLNQTPSAFRQLQRVVLSLKSPENDLALRLVIFGGEALDFRSLAPWFEKFGDSKPQLVNMYGITETTIHVTYRPVTIADTERNTSFIGRPLPDLRLYVLDAQKRLAPIGIPGELCVGGAGVSRGYLNRPDLTREKFIDNPFRPGETLYCSGDLGRVVPGGDIEYLGRMDHQVQLHGFRIELGEIESALTGSALVRDAVAQMRNERIVAWVVPSDGVECTVSALRMHLRKHLPDYMIPSTFVFLESIPLNANGKIDTKSLPEPGMERPELGTEFAGPRTPQEKILADIWTDVLGIEKVGVHDNFFELGGDSILSIRIVSKAAQAGLRISPKLLFQNQTVAELAAAAVPVEETPETEQGPVTGTAPLTPIQRWFLAQKLEDAHHWNQSVVLAIRKHVGNSTLEEAFRRLLEHHDALRIRLRNDTIEFAAPDGDAHFAYFDLSAESDAEGEFIRKASELQASLDLQHGPVARFGRFHMGSHEPDRIVLIVHHLATDGVSWRILIEDLNALCAGAQELPPRTVSYRDWAARTAMLPDYKTPVSAPENTEMTSRSVSVSLTAEETNNLLLRVPGIAGCRVEDVLLAALVSVLGPCTVNLEHHGRDAADLDCSRTVGWFTEFRPRKFAAPATESADAWIEAVMEQSSEPDTAPDVSFNYLGQFDETTADEAPFALTALEAGPQRSLRNRRAHRLDVSAAVFGGCLRVNWTFSSALDDRAGIERQADAYRTTLRRWIEGWVRFPVSTEVVDMYRLAPQQQGMLLESLVARDTGVHVEQLTCILDGRMDTVRFRDAWRAVIARHPALRTRFEWRGRTQPVQVVLHEAELPFEEGVWQSDRVEEYLLSEQRRSFRMDRAPLMRLGLFKIGRNQHRFVWTQHHSILDGWCQPLVLGEVLRRYRGDAPDGPAPRYRDYIGYLARADRKLATVFWSDYLKGFSRPTPVGRVETPSGGGSGYETIESCLGADVTRKLEAAAAVNHVSLGTVVLGAWALLLARYSGENDVLFGMTVAGRPADLSGAEEIVGLLANTLPCRTRIDTEAALWSWMQRLAESQAEMRAFETTSPAVIRRAAETPAAVPLHDSVLAFENYPADALTRCTDGLEFTIRDISFRGARTHQAVAILAIPGHELSLRFVFERERITPGSIPQDFCRLLTTIAESGDSATVRSVLGSIIPAEFPLYHPAARSTAPAGATHEMKGIQARLSRIWQNLLSVPSVGIHDNFFEAGGHSLIAVDLVTQIRREFGRDLPLSALIEAPTIALLAERIGSEDEPRRSPLVAINPDGNRDPLILLPGAGGNVLYFQPLAHYLGTEQPLYAIEAKGLDGREEIVADVEQIASDNVAILEERFGDTPYVLGGHSFGCMVSLEMALQLQRKGRVVPTLVILDDMAPVPGRIAPDDLHLDVDAIWLYQILRLAGRLQSRELSIGLDDLLPLDPDAQLDLAMQWLKEIDYLPASLERSAAHRYVQIFKTNFRASFRYVAAERFQGRVVLFRAQDPRADDPIVAYSRNFMDDPEWGWGQIADRVEVRWTPGDHISMMAKPNVAQLARAITDSFRAATLSFGAGRG